MALLQGTFGSTHQSEAPLGVSEIIVSSGGHEGLTLAMLAHLSHAYKTPAHHNRWLTWVCPMQLSKEALAQFNFDVLGMRILHPKSQEDALKLFRSALAAGTSHTVVIHGQGFSAKYIPWLNNAAAVGSCSGLIIRQGSQPL